MAPFEFHVGPAVSDFVGWLLRTYGDFFDAASRTLLSMLLTVEDILMWIPWWAMVAGVVVASWLVSRHVAGSLVLGGLLVVVVGFGLWEPTMTTLAIVVTSVILALIIGIPIGILMAEFRPVRAVMQPVLDVMQTMPSFVYLIPAMMLLGLGKVPAVLATWIYAVPPVIRLTHLGIEQVSGDVQEAALAYGATRWQLLKEVRLPLALPSLMAGVNQTTMMALAMVVVASMIGARGVGEEVLLSINRLDIGRGFEAGLAVVALAIVIDRLTQGVARRFEPPV
ncbi:MAG: ABC transporter permease subunit [Limnochordales bacterium]|nr:MAG: choline ABC transporter permease subunit [Bacillota bacterium]